MRIASPRPSSLAATVSVTLRAMLLVLLLGLGSAVAGQTRDPTPLQFSDVAEQKRFQRLTAELRCVMCQNQSLADSDAQIAHDLRREVIDLMQQGNSDAQVKQFLVERYGEFVLYRPQVSRSTWLLWFGPGLILLAGAVLVWRIVAARSGGSKVPADDGQEW